MASCRCDWSEVSSSSWSWLWSALAGAGRGRVRKGTRRDNLIWRRHWSGERAHGMGGAGCRELMSIEARQRYRFCLDGVSHRGSRQASERRRAVGVLSAQPANQRAGVCLRL